MIPVVVFSDGFIAKVKAGEAPCLRAPLRSPVLQLSDALSIASFRGVSLCFSAGSKHCGRRGFDNERNGRAPLAAGLQGLGSWQQRSLECYDLQPSRIWRQDSSGFNMLYEHLLPPAARPHPPLGECAKVVTQSDVVTPFRLSDQLST